jgi:hypothetical protein
MVGNYLYGRMGYALVCGAVFVGAGAVLIAVVRHLWQGGGLPRTTGLDLRGQPTLRD